MSDEAKSNHVFVLPPKIELSSDQFKCLLDEIGSLKSEIEALKIKISDLDKITVELRKENDTLADNQLIQLRLISQLRAKKEPGQTAHDRAKRLSTYMDARPDHKASYEALKGFLGVNDVLLNGAIATLKRDHPDKFVTIKDKVDKRKRILAVIPKIS